MVTNNSNSVNEMNRYNYVIISIIILSSIGILGCVSNTPQESNYVTPNSNTPPESDYVASNSNKEINLAKELESILAQDGTDADVYIDGSLMTVTFDATGWTSGELREFTRLLTLHMHNSIDGYVTVHVYHEKYNVKIAKGQYDSWGDTVDVELYL